MTNIMDPKIKNVRYYSCDELVDHLQPDFLGQVGYENYANGPKGRINLKLRKS